MTPAEIAASIKLTEHGRRLAHWNGWPGEPAPTTAHRLAWACSLTPDSECADAVAIVVRACPSIVALPSHIPAAGVAVVELHALRRGGFTDAGGIATITIDVLPITGKPTPRDLALTIAGLLA